MDLFFYFISTSFYNARCLFYINTTGNERKHDSKSYIISEIFEKSYFVIFSEQTSLPNGIEFKLHLISIRIVFSNG